MNLETAIDWGLCEKSVGDIWRDVVSQYGAIPDVEFQNLQAGKIYWHRNRYQSGLSSNIGDKTTILKTTPKFRSVQAVNHRFSKDNFQPYCIYRGSAGLFKEYDPKLGEIIELKENEWRILLKQAIEAGHSISSVVQKENPELYFADCPRHLDEKFFDGRISWGNKEIWERDIEEYKKHLTILEWFVKNIQR